MIFEETHYLGYDGLRMYMAAWLPDDERPRALLIAIHGLGSHGLSLRTIGEYMAEKGIAVFAPDMRGFGHYTGIKGHVMNFNEYIEDLQNIVMQVKDRFHNKLTFLYGHSLGGQHIIRYAATYPHEVDGLIIACPAVSQQLPISPLKKIGAWFLSLLNVKKQFSDDNDLTLSSRNPEVVREHEEDPLTWDSVTPRFGISGLRAVKEAFNAAPLIKLPALVQQAGDDKLVIPEKTRDFFDRLGSEDKEWILYEGLYHEIFREPEKERVLADMYNWLDKRLVS
ncbi:MAG: alpha/beta hydrolase [Candidatus Thorarchaeota archaeon]|nr:alpha/beta hydrolase [Candidatus Thorarchaeota archaeon]